MGAGAGDMVGFLGHDAWYSLHRSEILASVDLALESGAPIDGAAVAAVEARCAQSAHRRFAIAVNSGTDALVIALRAAGVSPGAEVIVTAFSFIASASAIVLAGAIPVFVDIDPATYLMDLDEAQKAITPRTEAIVAVQLYGQCLLPEALERLARSRALLLVEDAAQAFGASRHGRPAGSLGEVSVFSFDPSKVVGGVTTGGMVLTDDPATRDAALQLRSHGWNGSDRFDRLGYNSRMATINGAVLGVALNHEPDRARARRQIAQRYQDTLSAAHGLRAPPIVDGSSPNFHKFVVRSARRDEFRRHLAAHRIDTRVHYAVPLPDNGSLAGSCRVSGSLRQTRAACGEVLSLPIYPELTSEQIDRVGEALHAFSGRSM